MGSPPSSVFIASILLLDCFCGGRAQICQDCEAYLRRLTRAITHSESLDEQFEILLDKTCPNSGIPDCSSTLSYFWSDLQNTLNNERVIGAICNSIDAPGNCDEWQMDTVNCVACQARLGQFATIVLNTHAMATYTEALTGSLYCQPKCQNNKDCLEKCTSFVRAFFPLAIKDLTFELTSNALQTCHLVFGVC